MTEICCFTPPQRWPAISGGNSDTPSLASPLGPVKRRAVPLSFHSSYRTILLVTAQFVLRGIEIAFLIIEIDNGNQSPDSRSVGRCRRPDRQTSLRERLFHSCGSPFFVPVQFALPLSGRLRMIFGFEFQLRQLVAKVKVA